MWRFVLPAGFTIGILLTAWRIGRRLRRKYYLTEYLFFIRFPVILAAALFLFPIIGQLAAPEMFGSLFVLRPTAIAVVVFCACMCTWMIVYSAMVLWYATPFRAKLYFDRSAKRISPMIPGENGEVLLDPAAFYFLALILPLVISLIVRADGSRPMAFGAVAIGFLAAVGVRDGVSRLAPKLKQIGRTRATRKTNVDGREPNDLPEPVAAQESVTVQSVEAREAGEARGSAEKHETAEEREAAQAHRRIAEARYRVMGGRAKTFAWTSLAIYGLAGVAGWFVRSEFSASIPAVVYLLAVLLVVNWAAGYLSFTFDKFRVPFVSLVIVVVLIWTSVWPSDHMYPVSNWTAPPPKDVRQVLNDFATSRDGRVVVVAASGGGITAALWTTNVLRALDSLGKSIDTTFDFHSHVALVSSVSGGSVGAMYYVNAFGPSKRPERSLDSIVIASGKSSLSAAAWGMMYLDVIRLLPGEVMGRYDRAWAQERRWESSLGGPAGSPTPTLASWSAGVGVGWRPVQIFNVTLEETGERMLLAPVRLALADTTTKANPVLWREFQRLYPGHDVDVVTAARLSATFPYVTPHARPAVTAASLRKNAFHVADGGYYDNSGIVTALETISTWVNWKDYNHVARRIALVEIRAGGVTGESVDKQAKSPLLHSVSGPLNTLFNVRSTSQLARIQSEITLVKRLWACNPERPAFEHFVFRLSGSSPLSWHLTRDEAGAIERHLGTPLTHADSAKPKTIEARAQNDSEFVRLARFLIPPTVPDTVACVAK
jgi:hypothetical protein